MRPLATTNCANGKLCLAFDTVYGDDECLISPNTTVGLSQPFSASGVWDDLVGQNYASMWQWGFYPMAISVVWGRPEVTG
jgi:hypothetical protein